ncbi:MAG: SulP family inorganic anion transporter [Anaerovoracaceae bacterium]|nr:SulP family inorganic anion transporter [Anaerovoracaceae bacterium]
MEKMQPMLFTTLKNYSKEQFTKDLIAGVIVAIIALPLSIALALASGVGPEQGIFTAIIAGFLISVLGGSAVQVSGPTAAFATIVAGIVARNGMDGLATATILAGIILILMGLFRLGNLIKFIPFTITTGFTSGIAVTIVLGQLKDFFGVTYPEGMPTVETMEKVQSFAAGITTWNLDALIVGVVCLAILYLIPKFWDRVPASLVAVLVGIAMTKLLPLEVNTIGDLYIISNALPTFHIPHITYGLIKTALPDAFTIAILAAIESLLSCVVADGMINGRHRSNTELTAQGLGNVASALFGGIPATGAIARTAANVKNGGRTPIAGMVHALVLLLVLVVLMPYAALIPMPTIAAILIMVAYNMCQWRTFLRILRTSPKSDIIVLVLTFVLTVVFDLVVAIEVGMIMACVLFMKRMSEETDIIKWKYAEDVEDIAESPLDTAEENVTPMDREIAHVQEAAEQAHLRRIPKTISVFEITGPLFFGAADQVRDIVAHPGTRCLILRMRSVPALDTTSMNALNDLLKRCRKKNITLILSHVNEQPLHVMEKAGFVKKVGLKNICRNIDAAIERAEEIVSQPLPVKKEKKTEKKA